MKNMIFALSAVPMLAIGAQSSPIGSYLSVSETCAYLSGEAAQYLNCDNERVDRQQLPIYFGVKRNADAYSGEDLPLWCNREECVANTGPLIITANYGELRQWP